MKGSLKVDSTSTAFDFPHGLALLRDPLLNKGTAFSEQERDALGLRGLLPAHVLSQEEQAARILTNLRRLPGDLEKYVALNALHDRNEALFFRVVCDNIDEIQPLIYTPTVGQACQKFGDIFQRPRGLFIGANDRGRIAELLSNWPHPAKLIVVSDGERILGLSRFRSISRIACVPKIILGLTSSEITRERSDPAAQAGNCPLRHLTQIGLELAKRHLDRVQIRGILRQITKDGATRFNRFAHACCLVCRKVVHDHGVVTPQGWSQVVLHIIEERLSLHSPVNYIWRCHSLAA